MFLHFENISFCKNVQEMCKNNGIRVLDQKNKKYALLKKKYLRRTENQNNCQFDVVLTKL